MKKASVILIAFTLFCSCMQQALQSTYDKQTTTIESFVTACMKADTTATLTRTGGAYRVTMKDVLDPTRDSLGWTGKVTMEYALYLLSGTSVSSSNLVSTNVKAIASAAGWELSDTSIFAPVTLSMTGDLLEGLRSGLYGVQPLDEAYILFNGKYAYGNDAQGTIPANSGLVYHIWIDSIE